MFWFACQIHDSKTIMTSDINIENKSYSFRNDSKFISWNSKNLFTNEFSSSTKSTMIVRRIATHSNKILFQWMKSICEIVMQKTMLCIETINFEYLSMFFYWLIYSEKYMNFEFSNILNSIAWKKIFKRNYYWSKMRKTIRQYVRNCHECQWNKIFKNRQNDLLIFLIIFIRRWKNISMNFITELFNVHDYNFICTIIDRLNMKRHYVFCTIKNENTNVEIVVEILVQYVFRIYDLFFSITSNRDFQFILLVWQTFCKILRIKCKLFIVSHSEIDEQIEKINENIEKQLRQYYNYMQNDWDIWIFMTKFADNNAISTTTKLFFFSSTRIFIFVWTSRLILFRIQLRESDFWSSKRKISSISCETFSITFVITQR